MYYIKEIHMRYIDTTTYIRIYIYTHTWTNYNDSSFDLATHGTLGWEIIFRLPFVSCLIEVDEF